MHIRYFTNACVIILTHTHTVYSLLIFLSTKYYLSILSSLLYHNTASSSVTGHRIVVAVSATPSKFESCVDGNNPKRHISIGRTAESCVFDHQQKIILDAKLQLQ